MRKLKEFRYLFKSLKLLNQAFTFAKNKNYKNALNNLNEIELYSGLSPMGELLKGGVCYQLGIFDDSIASYQRGKTKLKKNFAFNKVDKAYLYYFADYWIYHAKKKLGDVKVILPQMEDYNFKLSQVKLGTRKSFPFPGSKKHKTVQ